MRHQIIEPGQTLALTASAKERYGLEGPYLVSHLLCKPGYKTPWICCKSNNNGNILSFRPSDFQGLANTSRTYS